MKRIVCAMFAVVALAGCGSESVEVAPTTTTTPSATPNPYPTPAYELAETGDGYVTAYVNAELSDDELSRIFYSVKSWYVTQNKSGGWFVDINCGAVDGPRLANGKFALDDLGRAQTGLYSSSSEFAPLPQRAPCG